MNSEIDAKVDNLWRSAMPARKQCEEAYKGFLTSLRLFADVINESDEVILRDAFGSAEKRKTEKSIGLWMAKIEDKWKANLRRQLEQRDRRLRRDAILARINLTDDEMDLLGIRP